MLWLSYLAMFLLLMVGILMIFIILLQRGRGGGLAGALGGMGGQSAFGTKAGDMFTRITVVLALIWIVLCAGQIPILRAVAKKYTGGDDANPVLKSAPIKEAGTKGKLELPDGDDNQADVKAEKGATKPKDARSPAAGKKDTAEKPAEDEKPDLPADSDAKTAPESKPAAESKDAPEAKDNPTETPAAESEQKSAAEPEKQP